MRIRNLLAVSLSVILLVLGFAGVNSAVIVSGSGTGSQLPSCGMQYTPLSNPANITYLNSYLGVSQPPLVVANAVEGGLFNVTSNGYANISLASYSGILNGQPFYNFFTFASLKAGQFYYFTLPAYTKNTNNYALYVSKVAPYVPSSVYFRLGTVAYWTPDLSGEPYQAVYVGQNITAGPYKVQLTGLSYPNANGVSSAVLNVYFNELTNLSQLYPGQTQDFNLPDGSFAIHVNQTFAGLYAYQRYAKLELFNQLTPLADLQINQSVTAGAFTVQLAGLGQPYANGTVPVTINVYYKGVLTNVTQVNPDQLLEFNVSGNVLYVNLNRTFDGLYGVQRFAYLQLLSFEAQKTVYLGQNMSSGPFTIQVTDLGQPNSNGDAPAALSVYDEVLTNTSQMNEHSERIFNVSGNLVDVAVNQTFTGLYAYQKWAQMNLTVYGSATPVSKVSVNQNLTLGQFTLKFVAVPGLRINSTDVNVYYNGALTNITQITAGSRGIFNVSGQVIAVRVYNTSFSNEWAVAQFYQTKLVCPG